MNVTVAQSMVRPATLLDILGVLSGMSVTERGLEEITQLDVLTQPQSLDTHAATLFTLSRGAAYAVVPFNEIGRAIAVGGFIDQRANVARSWMLATDEAWSRYGSEVTAYAAKALEARLGDSHRIEVVCLDSREKVKMWYARIGLKQEATLAKYCTDGSDAALFVKLRENT